ncbi:MAG: hypothetical protein ACK4SZ_11995 [Allosphingosinicella sp.]|uniref:hypothetical protein n=1 Tax=Allosphingosinicella sp. TaxID=2823234 RepID=UPI00393007A5
MTSPTDTTTRGATPTTNRGPSPDADTGDRIEASLDLRTRQRDYEEEQGFDEAFDIAVPLTPLPFFTVSGRYTYARQISLPITPIPIPRPIPEPIPERIPTPIGGLMPTDEIYDEDVNAIAFYQREEVQLDVDGRYPQMMISGTRANLFTTVGHWVAKVKKTPAGCYEGSIFYKNGTPGAIPHTFVSAKVVGGPFPATRKLEVVFSGGGAAAFTRTYAFDSAYRRKVEFEYDRVSDAVAVTSINTHAHPTRPASLANESLSIETVFRRSGFDATVSAGSGVVPIAAAGGDSLWTDQEMHDAMQIHWSRFANKPQWAMWVLFARLHVSGSSLGGIMFDDIGPNHRQGTAIFSHAFIATPPGGDPNPAAWVSRMRFWTAVHEMGHAFNLAHSWQKSLGVPWIPLANEPEARSFMNYPYYVSGGQSAFFANFHYRFSDGELQFMRHAPERFVQMGNEAWFSTHGFREAAQHGNPDYELKLTTSQSGNRFPYLMPPVVEIALVNRTGRTRTVSSARISEREDFTLILNGERQDARLWMPYMRHCGEGDDKVLKPGEALYDSVIAGAGKNGWDMAEPGRYCVQAVLEVDGQPVYSNQLMVTVEPPRTREEEMLAGDLFTPEVGQVLTANGTRGLSDVSYVLEKATELTDNPVSKLAAVALATPLAYSYKLLETDEQAVAGEAPQQRVEVYPADPQAARKLIDGAIEDDADALVNAVGHTRFLRDAPVLAALDREEVPNSPEAFLAFTADAEKADAATAVPLSDKLRSLLDTKAAGLSQ